MSTPPTPANDRALHPEVEQRRAERPQASVWVAANAGTGKTRVLTERVLALMLAGADPHEILCLTFTKAAAAEMSDRIARILGDWTTLDDAKLDDQIAPLLDRPVDDTLRRRARQLFARVLDAPGGMNIQTIHAFCQSLLGRFPIEARVAPHFSVMDERDARDMLAEAYEDVLIEARRQGEDGPLERALAQVTRHVNESDFAGLMAALTAARGKLKKLLARTGGPDGAAERLRRKLGLDAEDTPETLIAAAADQAFDKLGLTAAAKALAEGKKTDVERGTTLAAWLAASTTERVAMFESYALAFLVSDGDAVRKKLATKDVIAAAPGVEDALTVEAERLLAVKMKIRAAVTLEATQGLLHLGAALLDAYEAAKRNAALLDYDDLILAARDLLQRPDSAPWVLYKLDGGITHVLVDEAQDTNPEQWDVVRAITDEFFSGAGTHEHEAPRTVFAVGDVKQSIYSFQGADPQAFRDMRERFRSVVPAGGGLWDEVPLIISFRSVPAILAAVDAVFADAPAADGVNLDDETIKHEAWRAGEGGLVEIWPPIEAEETDTPPAWKPPVERIGGHSPRTRLAQMIAARIHTMVTDGDVLDSKGRPIRAGDIMVLVRRRTGFVEDLVRELKRLGTEVAGVDRMVLTDQIAVMDLIALGRFLLLPEDDLTLACVLKSPLIGLGEEDLFTLAHGRRASLWQALNDAAETDTRLCAVRDELAGLRAMTDTMPPFELYAHVLGPAGGRSKLVERLGAEAADPIAEFLDLALQFERGHVASLEGFLHWIEAGGVEIKRDLEESQRDAVRILTVHGAKGLQAPVVFLPDTMAAPGRVGPLLWPEDQNETDRALLWPPLAAFVEDVAEAERERLKDLQAQEYRRLLYVAMTRAEDRLYVAGWQTKNKPPEDCWYHLIAGALADHPDTVEDADGTLRLASPQTKTPEDKDKTTAHTPVFSGLPPFATAAAPPETKPIRPLRPSQMDDADAPVSGPFDAEGGSMRFKRGLLIHRLLEMLPTLPAEARDAAARAWLARPTHGLDADQQKAIAEEALGVLTHPDFAHLFGPESRAEVSITGRIPVGSAGDDEHVVSGQVDRLVIDTDDVTIIDYKTNRPPPKDEADVPALYLRQMAAYRAVLKACYPQKRVTCVLLWTDEIRLMALSEAILDTYAPGAAEATT